MGRGSSGAPGGSWDTLGAGVSAWILAAVRSLVELLGLAWCLGLGRMAWGLGVSPYPPPPWPRLAFSVKGGGLPWPGATCHDREELPRLASAPPSSLVQTGTNYVRPLPRQRIRTDVLWVEECPPATEHPSDNAANPLIKSRFHEGATSSLLLRKINNATFVKTPPFSWLYGGDREGATNPTS